MREGGSIYSHLFPLFVFATCKPFLPLHTRPSRHRIQTYARFRTATKGGTVYRGENVSPFISCVCLSFHFSFVRFVVIKNMSNPSTLILNLTHQDHPALADEKKSVLFTFRALLSLFVVIFF
jgi:hypothetical protein